MQGYIGFGLAARSESDVLSVTHWDFASQLGLRFRFPGDRVIGEVTMRHWSNGGIRLPNHGQDFATFTIRLNSDLFGLGKQERYAINPSFDLERTLLANSAKFQGEPCHEHRHEARRFVGAESRTFRGQHAALPDRRVPFSCRVP